jgi:hypothetical protein
VCPNEKCKKVRHLFIHRHHPIESYPSWDFAFFATTRNNLDSVMWFLSQGIVPSRTFDSMTKQPSSDFIFVS